MNTETVPITKLPQFVFSWIDYTVFIGMLCLSVLIGIYFGFFTKQNTTDEYLLGGKKMKIVPVAISLIASFISGITILGVPADVYKFGANYIWGCLCVIVGCLATAYIFLPVFFKLQFTTIFEYLKERFDGKVRTFASLLFTMSLLIYNPVVIYVPALALSQATGVNLHYFTPVISIICIFYTTIGGLKAVIWTDTLQFFGIIGSCVTIMIMGIIDLGGFAAIWNINSIGHRLDLLNFEFDPTVRDGVWAYFIGGTVYWSSLLTVHQGSVQKFLSVPTLADAKKVVAIYCIGIIVLFIVSVFTGNILYAKYVDCDPFLSKQMVRADQILPFFVMDIGGNIPGLPGIFIGGVFSAALSSMSASLNTVAGTIYQDFVRPFMPVHTTEKTASNILKLLVVILGTICILCVFIIEQMGGVLALIITLQGMIWGPLLGIFILGILLPPANSKGTFYGGLSALLITGWIVFNNQWYSMHGLLPNFEKPMSIDGCKIFVNETSSPINHNTADLPFILYRLSFWYNTFIGTFLTIALGLVISWFTREKNFSVHPDLLSPIVYCFLPKKDRELLELNQTLSLLQHREEKNNLNSKLCT